MSEPLRKARFYDEIIVPDERYYDALGQFVDEFARAESTAYLVLRFYAKLSEGVSAALLSGMRASDVMNRLRRLYEVGAMQKSDWLDAEPSFQQFNIIYSTRDTLLHYGAQADKDGNRTVTTMLKAHIKEKATTFPISVQILNDMRHDLKKIIVHLHLRHLGRPPLRAKHPELLAILREPWRYRPPQSRRAKGRKQVSSGPAEN